MRSLLRRLRNLLRSPVSSMTASESVTATTPADVLSHSDEAYLLTVAAATSGQRADYSPEMAEPLSVDEVGLDPGSQNQILPTIEDVRTLVGVHVVEDMVESIGFNFECFEAWIAESEKGTRPVFDYAAPECADLLVEFRPSIAPQLERSRVSTDGKVLRRHRTGQAIRAIFKEFSLSAQSQAQLHAVFGKAKSLKTLKAVRRLLASGYSVDDILCANAIRLVWRAHECFQRAEHKFIQNDRWGTRFQVLPSWADAMVLTNLFGRSSDYAEIEFNLDRYFSIWSKTSAWNYPDQTFLEFLIIQMHEFADDSRRCPADFFIERHEPWGFGGEDEQNDTVHRELLRLGLIPDIWADPFEDRVCIDPALPLLQDCLPKLKIEEIRSLHESPGPRQRRLRRSRY